MDDEDRKVNCFEVASRGIITVLNLLFFLVSASMIIFGCIIKYGSSNLLRYLEPIFDSIEKISSEKNYPLGHISISHLILEAATVAIVLGAVLLCIAWFGWCGACCRQRTMLVLYCGLLTLLLALQVTVVVLLVVMRSRVDLALKKPWKDTLVHQYRGIQGQDTLSVSWNYIMNSLDCCGVEGSEDFDKSKNWDRIYHDPHTRRSVHLSIPLICCKYLGEYPDIEPPRNFTCAIVPDLYNSNYKKGCYNEIWNYISRAELTLACVMMLATIIQMMLIFSSVYLISKISTESKYDEDE